MPAYLWRLGHAQLGLCYSYPGDHELHPRPGPSNPTSMLLLPVKGNPSVTNPIRVGRGGSCLGGETCRRGEAFRDGEGDTKGSSLGGGMGMRLLWRSGDGWVLC